MEFKKNQIVELYIDDIGNEGEGIGHIDGYALFLKDTVIGDKVRAKIIKTKKNYGFARVEEVLEASKDRVNPRCSKARQCGGCTLQHLAYEKQLEYKFNKVKNCLERIGGLENIEEKMEPILGMEEPFYYRNKAQFPVGYDKEGNLITGFYAGRTHHIIDCTHCMIQHPVNEQILLKVLDYMKKNNIKWMVGIGVASILALVISCWYSVTYNNSRLVVPTDFASYTFQIKDLPMIISVSFFCLYVLGMVIALFLAGRRQAQQAKETNRTRRLNPKLGYLGFLGFLGFAGFWTYQVDESVYPFVFFLFFGFFGFYYEGKMSGTFMDERFRENADRAQLTALKISYAIIFIALIALCQKNFWGNLDFTLIAVIIIISFALGLEIFLSEYLLYRYDHDDEGAE